MTRLSIALFGPLQVTLDGQPVTAFESDKVRALLAYLAVESDAPQRREKLAGLLWPELPERTARANLRHVLANLRTMIGDRAATPPFLHITRQTIQFNRTSDAQVDVLTFQDLLSSNPPRSTDLPIPTPQTIHHLEDAVGLYRGDFLEGFSLAGCPDFEEWMLFEGERLRRLTLETLSRLSDWYEQQGKTEHALRHARRQVDLDPLQESAHRQIMLLLAHSGQRGVALAQYQTCHRVLLDELGVEPSAETTTLYERIRDGTREPPSQVPTPASTSRHNLLAPLTPFVGREVETAQIRDRLRDPACRLLTLVGPGGIGKTRLALEAVATEVGNYQHGVYQVRLAGVKAVDSIMPTAAKAIGFSFYGAGKGGSEVESRQQLLDYLHQKNMLLVIDNFEHLLDGVDVVTDILRAAPGVSILVTSRTKLNLKGEHLFPVAGLAFPEKGTLETTVIGQCDAAKLFLTGAQRMYPSYDLAGHEPDVTIICRLVQGMPLAILLASAWVEMMSPADIAKQIVQSLDFLGTGWRDVPERHRSIRAVFDHSWRLLTEREREILQTLSVFRGGFDQKAAQHVAGASMHDLRSLIDKSFLHPLPTARYEVHDLLRQYTTEKLERSPVASEAAHSRHCAYYTAALQQWSEDLKGPRQQAALAEMDVEIENARAAWDWAVEREQLERLDQAAEGLYLFYGWRMRFQEGESAFRLAAEKLKRTVSGDGVRISAKVTAQQSHSSRDSQLLSHGLLLLEELALAGRDTRSEKAFVLKRMGDAAHDADRREARRLYEQSLMLYRELGDGWATANALHSLGGLAWQSGAYDKAKQLSEESLVIRRALDDQKGVGRSLELLGLIALYQGEVEGAEDLLRESLAIARQTGALHGVVRGLANLAATFTLLGKFAEAQSLCEEAIAIYRELGLHPDVPRALIGDISMHLGRYEQARAQGHEGLVRWRGMDHPRAIGHSIWQVGCVALAEEAYDEARKLLQESIAVFRGLGQRDEQCWPLATLAYAAHARGQLAEASQHLTEVIRTASEIRAFKPLLIALPAIALLLADLDRKCLAVECYSLASRYPFVANSRWFEDIAGRHIAAVATTLPPEAVAAAQERGRARDLKATVADLLVELEGVGTPAQQS
jgi:predicted ATPase/DNA-binding SARP family transcriptional activator